MLEAQHIEVIEAKAEDTLRDIFGEKVSLPIDLGRIANAYGISLKETSFSEDDVLGLLDRELKTIFVAKELRLPKMSFTVAHELGHYMLHRDKEKDVYLRLDAVNLDIQDNVEELEANQFAASVLMPRALVTKYWETIKDVDQLCAIFGVSKSAMYYRLRTLKLI